MEYHRRNAEALIHSMNHDSHRHNCIIEKLLRSQIALLRQKAFDLQAQHRESSIPLKRLLGFNMRVRQLLSIKLSNVCVIKENNRHFSEDLKWISAFVLSKRIVYNPENLVHVIAKPLVALGASTPTDLLEANNTHTITGYTLKLKFGRHCSDEHIIALNRLSALLNPDSATVTTQDITRELHRSKGCNTLTEDRKVNTAPLAIEGLCQAFEQERTERQATICVRTLRPAPNTLPMPTHTPLDAPPTFQRHPITLRRVMNG